MAYSIPVSNVMDIIDSLMSRETRSKVSSSETAYLGISGVDITSAMSSSYGYPQGVLIRSVENNSAAAQAGPVSYTHLDVYKRQVVGYLCQILFFSVDYSRTEYVQYEDDEYYYYVKAVPKINIVNAEVKVKQINARKTKKAHDISDMTSSEQDDENI